MAERRRRQVYSEESEDETNDISKAKSEGDISKREDSEYESYTDDTQDEDTVDEDTVDDETVDEDDSEDGSGSDIIIEDGLDEERQSGDGEEQPKSTTLDDDEDTKNPAYVPRKGPFYFHDQRLTEEEYDKQTDKVKKKLWLDECKWLHDKYNETDQTPKSRHELTALYGYDILAKDNPPEAPPLRNKYRGNPRERYNQISDFVQNDDFASIKEGHEFRRGRGGGYRGNRGRYDHRGQNDRGDGVYDGESNEDKSQNTERFDNHERRGNYGYDRVDSRRGRVGARNQTRPLSRGAHDRRWAGDAESQGVDDSSRDNPQPARPKQVQMQMPYVASGKLGFPLRANATHHQQDTIENREPDRENPKVVAKEGLLDVDSGVVLTIETGPGKGERRGNSYMRDRKARGGFVRVEGGTQDARLLSVRDARPPPDAALSERRTRGTPTNKAYINPPRLQAKTSTPVDPQPHPTFVPQQQAKESEPAAPQVRPKRYSTQRQRPAPELPYPEVDVATARRPFSQIPQQSQTYYSKGYPQSIYQPVEIFQPAEPRHEPPVLGEGASFSSPPQHPPLQQYAPVAQNKIALSPPAISPHPPRPRMYPVVSGSVPTATQTLLPTNAPPQQFMQPPTSALPPTVVQAGLGQFFAAPPYAIPIPIQFARQPPLAMNPRIALAAMAPPRIVQTGAVQLTTPVPRAVINTHVPPPPVVRQISAPIGPALPQVIRQITAQVPSQVAPPQVPGQVPPQIASAVQLQAPPQEQEVCRGGTTYYSTELQQHALHQHSQAHMRRHRTAIPIVDPQETSPYDFTVPGYYQQVINQHGEVVAQFAYSQHSGTSELNPDQPPFLSQQHQLPPNEYLVNADGIGPPVPEGWVAGPYVGALADGGVSGASDSTYVEDDSTGHDSSFEDDCLPHDGADDEVNNHGVERSDRENDEVNNHGVERLDRENDDSLSNHSSEDSGGRSRDNSRDRDERLKESDEADYIDSSESRGREENSGTPSETHAEDSRQYFSNDCVDSSPLDPHTEMINSCEAVAGDSPCNVDVDSSSRLESSEDGEVISSPEKFVDCLDTAKSSECNAYTSEEEYVSGTSTPTYSPHQGDALSNIITVPPEFNRVCTETDATSKLEELTIHDTTDVSEGDVPALYSDSEDGVSVLHSVSEGDVPALYSVSESDVPALYSDSEDGVSVLHSVSEGDVPALYSVSEDGVSVLHSVSEGDVPALYSVSEGDVPALYSVSEGDVPALYSVGEGDVPALYSVSEGDVPALYSVSEGDVPALYSVSEGDVPALYSVSEDDVPALHSESEDDVPALHSVSEDGVSVLNSVSEGDVPALHSVSEGDVAALHSVSEDGVSVLHSVSVGDVPALHSVSEDGVSVLHSVNVGDVPALHSVSEGDVAALHSVNDGDVPVLHSVSECNVLVLQSVSEGDVPALQFDSDGDVPALHFDSETDVSVLHTDIDESSSNLISDSTSQREEILLAQMDSIIIESNVQQPTTEVDTLNEACTEIVGRSSPLDISADPS